MILRRVIAHFRKQEWTAIAIDFLIVVVGVFVGLQVNTWNAARTDRSHAGLLVGALHAEFEGIETELEKSLENITRYQAASRNLATALRGGGVPPEDDAVKGWLLNTINLGRQSPRSAIYLQMVSDGDLRLIRNQALIAALIRFDQRIERNAFVYAGTLDIMFSGDTLFDAVEFDDSGSRNGRTVLGYDAEMLTRSRSRIEAASLAQSSLKSALAEQLDDARVILTLLERSEP